jgi:outer membrane protein assembly factor BamB
MRPNALTRAANSAIVAGVAWGSNMWSIAKIQTRKCNVKFLSFASLIITVFLTTAGLSVAQSTEATGRNLANNNVHHSGTQTSWAQVYFDNARTSFNPFEKVLSRSTVRRLKQEWTFDVGGYVSGPAVANGIAYVGSGDGHVYAIDVATGKLRWKLLLDSSFDASWPTVVNGTVYVGTGVDQGQFFALNAGTGAIIWKFRPGGGVFNSPAVVDGRVYFGANDGDVYALDAATGKLLWKFPTGSLSSLLDPAVANGHVYITAGNPSADTLYALNASDGSLAWSFSSANSLGTAIVGDGKVYLGESDFPEGGFIYAFDAANGNGLWTLNLGDGGAGFLAFANGVVYTDSSNGTDNFLAIDAASGRELWGSTNFVSLPVIANGVIYGFPKSGQLAALSAANGKLLKTISTIGNTTGIAVVNGNVYSAGYIDTNLLIKYGVGNR